MLNFVSLILMEDEQSCNTKYKSKNKPQPVRPYHLCGNINKERENVKLPFGFRDTVAIFGPNFAKKHLFQDVPSRKDFLRSKTIRNTMALINAAEKHQTDTRYSP